MQQAIFWDQWCHQQLTEPNSNSCATNCLPGMWLCTYCIPTVHNLQPLLLRLNKVAFISYANEGNIIATRGCFGCSKSHHLFPLEVRERVRHEVEQDLALLDLGDEELFALVGRRVLQRRKLGQLSHRRYVESAGKGIDRRSYQTFSLHR